MFVYCHLVIFVETINRYLEQEELLRNIIRDGGDSMSFLNDTDGQEGEGEEADGYDLHGSDDPIRCKKERVKK